MLGYPSLGTMFALGEYYVLAGLVLGWFWLRAVCGLDLSNVRAVSGLGHIYVATVLGPSNVRAAYGLGQSYIAAYCGLCWVLLWNWPCVGLKSHQKHP